MQIDDFESLRISESIQNLRSFMSVTFSIVLI